MKLGVKTAIMVGVISFLGAIFHLNVNIFYIRRDWSGYWEQSLGFMAAAAALIIIAMILIMLMFRNISRTERKMADGTELNEGELDLFEKRLDRVSTLIAVVNGVGAIVIPMLMEFQRSRNLDIPFISYNLLSVLIMSISVGAYVIFVETTIYQRFLLSLKTLIGKTHIDAFRRNGVENRQIYVSLTIIVFSFGLMYSAGMGYLREELLAPAAVDAVGSATQVSDYRVELWSQALGGGNVQLNINSPQIRPRLGEYALKMAILGVIIIGLAFAAAQSESRIMGRRLAEIELRIRELSSGAADRNAKIYISREDILGKIISNINEFIDRQANLLDTIRQAINDAGRVSSRLNEVSREAQQVGDGIGSGSNAVKTQLAAQSTAMSSAGEEVSRLSKAVAAMRGTLEEQSQAVTLSSSAVEEMVANIASVARNSSDASNRTTQLIEAANTGEQEMMALEQSIEEIATSASKVNENVGIIAKIAAQTNLLAMNAAIEAAHAGDIGSGFAVVASEVRKLAESSSRSAREITEMIRSMNSRSESGLGLARRTIETFTGISQGVRTNAEIMAQISQAMVEQDQGNATVQESMIQLRNMSNDANELTRVQTEGSAAMQSRMEELEGAATNIQQVMNTNLQLLAGIDHFLGDLQASIEENSDIIDRLRGLVSG